MNRHRFLLFTTLALFLLPCTPSLAATPSAGSPNILFILIDDMGWKDIGCAGSTYFETPHIDKLAAEGVRFLNAYSAAPVCTPSRGAILSGKCPARTQLTTVFRGPAGPDDRLHEKSKYRGDNDQFFEARHRHALPKTEVILAQALAAGGYRTGFFGKWHCGECPDYYPDDRGFHVAKGYRTQAVSTQPARIRKYNCQGCSVKCIVEPVAGKDAPTLHLLATQFVRQRIWQLRQRG